MVYLSFLGGVIVGCIITQIITHHKTGFGYFKLIPTEDEGVFNLNIRVAQNQNLTDVKQIVLKRDRSQN